MKLYLLPCYCQPVPVAVPLSPRHSHPFTVAGMCLSPFHCHVLCLSPCRCRLVSAAMSLSPCHCRPVSIVVPLSRCHYRPVSVVVSLSWCCCHPATVTVSLSLCHCHPLTVAGLYLLPFHCHRVCLSSLSQSLCFYRGVSLTSHRVSAACFATFSLSRFPRHCHCVTVTVYVTFTVSPCHCVIDKSHYVSITVSLCYSHFSFVIMSLPPGHYACHYVTASVSLSSHLCRHVKIFAMLLLQEKRRTG